MLDDQNANPAGTVPVVDAIGESLDAKTSDVAFNDFASAWIGHDCGHGRINRVKKFTTEASQSSFVETGGLNQFSLSFGVVGYSHPMLRRAFSMT